MFNSLLFNKSLFNPLPYTNNGILSCSSELNGQGSFTAVVGVFIHNFSVSTEEIHVGDVGLIVDFDFLDTAGLPQDISGATSTQVTFLKPDGSITLVSGEFETNGVDGVLRCVIVSNFLDMEGTWLGQAVVDINQVRKHSSTVKIKVKPNLIN